MSTTCAINDKTWRPNVNNCVPPRKGCSYRTVYLMLLQAIFQSAHFVFHEPACTLHTTIMYTFTIQSGRAFTVWSKVGDDVVHSVGSPYAQYHKLVAMVYSNIISRAHDIGRVLKLDNLGLLDHAHTSQPSRVFLVGASCQLNIIDQISNLKSTDIKYP
jgi:hypothetical protein